MEKIIKVEFERETDIALFCLVTYKVSKWFKKDVEVTDLYSLRRFSISSYSSIAYKCDNNEPNLNISQLMIASKKGVVLTRK